MNRRVIFDKYGMICNKKWMETLECNCCMNNLKNDKFIRFEVQIAGKKHTRILTLCQYCWLKDEITTLLSD